MKNNVMRTETKNFPMSAPPPRTSGDNVPPLSSMATSRPRRFFHSYRVGPRRDNTTLFGRLIRRCSPAFQQLVWLSFAFRRQQALAWIAVTTGRAFGRRGQTAAVPTRLFRLRVTTWTDVQQRWRR